MYNIYVMGIAVAYCILYDVNTNKYCAKAYCIFYILYNYIQYCTYSEECYPENPRYESKRQEETIMRL